MRSGQGPRVVQMSNSLYFTTHQGRQTQLPLKGSGGTEVTVWVAFNSPDRSSGPISISLSNDRLDSTGKDRVHL